MERLQEIINQLQEQAMRKAEPSQMLVTTRQLEAELNRLSELAARNRVSTTKIAVVMPSSMKIYTGHAAAEEARNGESRPSAGENKPSVQEVRTPGYENRISASEERSSVSESREPVSETRPPVSETRAPVSETRPPVGDMRPPVSETRPPAGDTWPPVSETRLPMSEGRPPVSETRLPVSDSRLPVSDSRLPASDNRPSVNENKPSVQEIKPIPPENIPYLPAERPVSEPKPVVNAAAAARQPIPVVADAPSGRKGWQYDPLADIPTLSPQATKEINDVMGRNGSSSLNDKLRSDVLELRSALNDTPVRDLKKAIGINDRYVFISQLFRGDEVMYERSLKTINAFRILPEAEYWMERELKVKLGWDENREATKLFYNLVRRRFA